MDAFNLAVKQVHDAVLNESFKPVSWPPEMYSASEALTIAGTADVSDTSVATALVPVDWDATALKNVLSQALHQVVLPIPGVSQQDLMGYDRSAVLRWYAQYIQGLSPLSANANREQDFQNQLAYFGRELSGEGVSSKDWQVGMEAVLLGRLADFRLSPAMRDHDSFISATPRTELLRRLQQSITLPKMSPPPLQAARPQKRHHQLGNSEIDCPVPVTKQKINDNGTENGHVDDPSVNDKWESDLLQRLEDECKESQAFNDRLRQVERSLVSRIKRQRRKRVRAKRHRP